MTPSRSNSAAAALALLRSMKGAAAFLGIILIALPAAAVDWNRGPGPEDYPALSDISESPPNNQLWFHYGLVAGLQAAKEEYAKAGKPPLYCLPSSFQPAELRHLLVAELKANGEDWRRRPEATLATIAVDVVRRRYPC